ncbi:MAG: hypothetical protein GY831_10360, partial [Delftia sp.]|nr:hypothetical protein [Delftia sp.]
DLDAPIARARDAEARADDAASEQVVRQYRGLLEGAAGSELYGNEHYMVVWMNETQTGALAQGLRNLGLLTQPRLGLPPLIEGRYRDTWYHLTPVAGRGPFMAILTSYDLLGAWDWRPLASLLYQGYPITVSLDVVTLPKVQAHRSLNMSRNALQASLADIGQDVELTERWTALHQAIQAVNVGQTLHLITVGVMVPGRTAEELEERVEAIKTAMGPYMSLAAHRPQSDLLRILFTTAHDGPAERLVSKRLRRNTLSTGAATAMGMLGASRRGDTDGILWGFGDDGSPVFWDGFGPDLDEANHGVFLGMTGSGKTFGVHMLLLREA